MLLTHTLTLCDIILTIISSESSFIISAKFQFSETLSNTESFNIEFFKAAIVKDSEIWFKYFKNYYMKVTQFKNYYESIILKAQQLQNTVSMLNNTIITLTEENSVFTQY